MDEDMRVLLILMIIIFHSHFDFSRAPPVEIIPVSATAMGLNLMPVLRCKDLRFLVTFDGDLTVSFHTDEGYGSFSVPRRICPPYCYILRATLVTFLSLMHLASHPTETGAVNCLPTKNKARSLLVYL